MGGFADHPVITGDAIVLRPMVASDAAHLWADLSDDEANRMTGSHDSFTRDQIDRWAASRSDQDDRFDLAVTDRATGAWLGEVVINDWDEPNQSCGFRIALAADARNRGVGTEATRLVVDHVFRELPINRIELEVYAFNARGIAVYEKVGFRREGTRREALRWEGEFVDAITMGILRSDWNAAH